MSALQGKGALITGAAGGIGAATAQRLANDGAALVLADRDLDAVTAVAADLQAQGAQATAIGYDQKKPETVLALVEQATQVLDGIDILFANAGYGRYVPVLEVSQQEWDRATAININGLFTITQAVAKQMVERQIHGSIIVTASVCASFVGNQLAAYCTSKAGALMLARCLATELGNYRIRVNAVSPGVIETPMTAGNLADERIAGMVRHTTPLGRWGEPREIADVVAFLASEQSSFVNGQDITVCGGQSNPLVPQWNPLDYQITGSQDWDTPKTVYPFTP
ncbi:MAG: SDR family NAD(P)-dependent oxidoreductase [Beutenbergiaceae bacterium]